MNSDASKASIFERQLAGKAARRREQANLPIESKIDILVKMQRTNAQMARQKGRPARAPWNIRQQAAHR